MPRRFLTVLAGLLPALACALPVSPAIERTLTDDSGRTVEARIVGITTSAVEIVRREDGVRFLFPVERLSAEDRTYAAELLVQTEANRPLPETPWLAAIRRDFQIFDAVSKRLVPLPTDHYARDPILVLAFGYAPRGENPFEFRLSTRTPVPDQVPVLWLFSNGEPALFALAAEKLPERHALLSQRVMVGAMADSRHIYQEYFSAWHKRNELDSNNPRFTPSDQERDELRAKLRKVLPAYWVSSVPYYMGENHTSPQIPDCHAVRRDGSPVRFRGEALAGSREVVMQVLRDHADELE